MLRSHSSVGRARACEARGRRFKPCWLHQLYNPFCPTDILPLHKGKKQWFYAFLAQLEEHQASNLGVVGSSPAGCTISKEQKTLTTFSESFLPRSFYFIGWIYHIIKMLHKYITFKKFIIIYTENNNFNIVYGSNINTWIWCEKDVSR